MTARLTPPSRAQLLTAIAADLLSAHGRHADEIDLTHVEAREAADWLAAARDPADDAAAALAGALDLTIIAGAEATRERWNRLLLAILDDVTADRLIELRDAMRAALIDSARTDIRAELPLVMARLVEQRCLAEAERRAELRRPAPRTTERVQ